jgi:hypothetical protein
LLETVFIFRRRLLQDKIIGTVRNLSRRTLVRHLHTASDPKYIYEYVAELCRLQAEVTRNHENYRVCSVRQDEI